MCSSDLFPSHDRRSQNAKKRQAISADAAKQASDTRAGYQEVRTDYREEAANCLEKRFLHFLSLSKFTSAQRGGWSENGQVFQQRYKDR